MLVSVYLCKNLNRKRAAAGSESAGDAVLPKEKCGASGKECGAKKRLLEKMPQGAGAFRRGCRGCGKTNAQGRRAPEAFLLTEKTGFAGGERFSVGIIPPHIFNYTQTRLLAKMKTMQTALLMSLTVVKPLGLRLLQNPRVFPGIFIADDLLLLISFPSCLISRKMS